MNRKIVLSVIALPVSAILAFILSIVVIAVLDINQTNIFSKTQIGYGILYGAIIIYLTSLALVWTGKLFKASSGQEVMGVQPIPWSYLSVFIFSTLFGPGASYLITWQNLKRMGKTEIAGKFLALGGLVLIILLAVLYLLPQSTAKALGNISAIIFPIWLYYSYQKQWQTDNPKKAKFSWSLFGWSLLGILLIVVIFALLNIVWKK